MQSLIGCFVGTFKVYAKASKVVYSELKVTGKLTVDHDAEKQIRMKKCDLQIDIYGAERADRVQTLVDKVLRDGFILNSVKTEVTHEVRIHAN